MKSYNILKRCKCFVAALALKQNLPEKALELIGTDTGHVTPRFIYLIASTKAGNFNDALNILTDIINNYIKNQSMTHQPKFNVQIVSEDFSSKE